MKKTFKKLLVSVVSLSMIATLVFAPYYAKEAKADEDVEYSCWSFTQAGQFNPGEPGNEGYINKVTMNDTGEVLNGWLTGEGSLKQTQTADEESDGFAIEIANTGWDRTYDTVNKINPWAVTACTYSELTPNHAYRVSFKARASTKKYCYVTFGTDVGEYIAPYGDAPMRDGSSAQAIAITETEKTFTYEFDNDVEAEELKATLMLGAFCKSQDGKVYDYAGNDISDIVTEEETGWSGTVYVSDFTVEDLGGPEEESTQPSGDEKIETYIDLYNDDAEVGKNYTYEAYLYYEDDEGDEVGLSGQTLTFKVNGKTYTAITGSDGIASINHTFENEGEYTFYVSYAGNATYESCSEDETIEAYDEGGGEYASTQVVIPDQDDAIVNQPYEFVAYLYDDDEHPIKGASLSLYVDDDEYLGSAETDSSGCAKFSFTPSETGIWALSVEYDGDEDYDEASADYDLRVRSSDDDRVYTYMDDLTDVDQVDVGEAFSYSGTLYDEDDNTLEGRTINLIVDGTYKTSTMTNSDGEFTFELCFYDDGEHIIEVEFEGDVTYAPCSDDINIFVGDEPEYKTFYYTHPSQVTAQVGETISYQVGLFDEDTDAPLKGRTIYLYLDEEGEGDGIPAITNKDGIATFNLSFDKVGRQDIYVYYGGGEDYYSNEFNDIITVTEKTAPETEVTTTSKNTNTTKPTPAQVTGLKAKNKKKRKAILSWKKVTGAKSYQVKYAKNKKFKKAKIKIVSKNKITLKKLKKKKAYFFAVRAYNGYKYGAWSATKKLKIKK